MGAMSRLITFERCATLAEFQEKWKAAQAEDAHQRGHDSYRGSINEVDMRVDSRRVATRKDAIAYLEAKSDDIFKRDALAVAYGDVSKAFPASKTDKAMVEKLNKLSATLATFELTILQRFLASKSASKKCPHCDSVISKKSRQSLLVQAKHGLSTLKGFELKDLKAELTACPACHGQLLMTATDLSKRKALEKSHGESAVCVMEAKKKYFEKAPEYGYAVLAMVAI